MFDASCSFAIEVQILLFMLKCVNRERIASERVRISLPYSPQYLVAYIPITRVQKITRVGYRIEQPKNCSIQH